MSPVNEVQRQHRLLSGESEFCFKSFKPYSSFTLRLILVVSFLWDKNNNTQSPTQSLNPDLIWQHKRNRKNFQESQTGKKPRAKTRPKKFCGISP